MGWYTSSCRAREESIGLANGIRVSEDVLVAAKAPPTLPRREEILFGASSGRSVIAEQNEWLSPRKEPFALNAVGPAEDRGPETYRPLGGRFICVGLVCMRSAE